MLKKQLFIWYDILIILCIIETIEYKKILWTDEIKKSLQVVQKNVAQRNRQSPFPMISVEEALELIYKSVQKTETEVVNVKNAYGRILVKDVHSFCDLPPFRASIKDGYAVLASDGKGTRKVLCGVTAGTEVSCDNNPLK